MTAGYWPSSTDRGVVLWDLAHGTELGFLGIGYARVLFRRVG